MNNNQNFNYIPLTEPVQITEHKWPENSNPLVSISCLTYNHRNFIEDAINGFLIQKTTFPVEIVIHDDASNDGTTEIIKEYEFKYPQLFKCFYQPKNCYKRPESFELRRPFRKAIKGKYIADCEGDDYWTDSLKLQKQFDFMESNPNYSLCYHKFKILENGSFHLLEYPVFGKDYSADELIQTPDGIATATKFYKNSIDYDLVYKTTSGGLGDYTLNAYLGSFGHCKFIKSISPSVYRRHSGGVWSSKEELVKDFGLIATKYIVFQIYRQFNDKRRAILALEALNQSIKSRLKKFEKDKNKIFCKVDFNRFLIDYRGIAIEFVYGPIIRKIKRIFKK